MSYAQVPMSDEYRTKEFEGDHAAAHFCTSDAPVWKVISRLALTSVILRRTQNLRVGPASLPEISVMAENAPEGETMGVAG
jgi:hypothetical protein